MHYAARGVHLTVGIDSLAQISGKAGFRTL